MIDILIGAFIGALASGLWVGRQCAKRDMKNDNRLVALETTVGTIDKGIQAALIQHGDIIKVITKPHARSRKTRKGHK